MNWLDRWRERRRQEAENRIMALFAIFPSASLTGYAVSKFTRMRSGRAYPALTRLLEKGLLADGWTDEQPRRRYYELTLRGWQHGRALARRVNAR